MKPAAPLRSIPAVEKVLQALGDAGLPRPLTVDIVRRELATLRKERGSLEFQEVLARVRQAVQTVLLTRIQPLINGTGILVHTNLGRAPFGDVTVRVLADLAASYNNLEFDLTTGERGHRAEYVERCLSLLCGAEAATVVNNCAAALLLSLRHFTKPPRNEVVISRGELVQIGGGFRIPEILETSGARLREVGTTNKTSLQDYAKAIGKETGLILKVHRSNFFMSGFVDSPATDEIAALARRKRIPFIEDLGSGAMIATEKVAGLEHEPTPAETLKRGVDLVCFSGDKLLGGPQAGIIAGKAKIVAALKREPFFRALRCDKLILAALQTTSELYLSGEAETGVPILAMLRTTPENLRERAKRVAVALAELPVQITVGAGKGQIGGGTLPRSSFPSVTVELQPRSGRVEELAMRLRAGSPPVIGCIAHGRFKLDLRTVLASQDEALIQALRNSLKS